MASSTSAVLTSGDGGLRGDGKWKDNGGTMGAFEFASTHQHGGPSMMFLIERSNNLNMVIYKFDQERGCTVNWIMMTKGGACEELNMIERNTAYGCTVTPNGDGTFKLVVQSLKDRQMTVAKNDQGVWVATTTIGGVKGIIKAVHVEMKTWGWVGMPTVDYVEIHGVNAAGEPLYEKKSN